MLKFTIRRLMLAVVVGLFVSFFTFLLLHAVTDPAYAIAGEGAEPEVVEKIRVEYGLDRPFLTQYFSWLWNALQGDFGKSYHWSTDVATLVAEHAPVTIQLALMAVVVTIAVAVPLGVVAALKPNSWIDRICLAVAVSAQAVPNFWLGTMLIIYFAVALLWLPASGDETFAHFIMPAIVLGTSSVPAVMRLTRTGLIEVMNADFIRTARSKGYRGTTLLFRHALKNAILPVISVLAVQLGQKFGGSVIVEQVFSLNGLGRLTLNSILGSDIFTVQILIFIFAMIFILMNFLADILNALLDPRIRVG